MPEKGVTKKKDVEDAKELAHFLGIKVHIKPINNIVKKINTYYSKLRKNKIALGNCKARSRMVLLYTFANLNKFMVAGTGNKSELLMGYFTKYGDGGTDFLPIGNLYKTDVIKIAKELMIPKSVIEKKPSAGLWKNQTDEQEMGMTYEVLDRILKGNKKGISKRLIEKVKKQVKKSKHKREIIPICKV